jgi:hypothetical protein
MTDVMPDEKIVNAIAFLKAAIACYAFSERERITPVA